MWECMLCNRSPLKIDLSPILTDCIPILASFLRKNHRALRLSTLQCLDVLVKHYGKTYSAALSNKIMVLTTDLQCCRYLQLTYSVLVVVA